MKKLVPIISLFLLPFLTESCIFQSDPLAPNNPPVLNGYDPQVTYFSIVIPDSCVFSIDVVDPDNDQLEYMFTVRGELVSESSSYTFKPLEDGYFNIKGMARDGSDYVFREWFVTVQDKANEPPQIVSRDPEQTGVAMAVGNILHFSFSVEDDNPPSLRYSYTLDDETLIQYLTSSDYDLRILETGQFVLKGIVTDGQYQDTTAWNVTVTGFPDTIPPSVINDLAGVPGNIMGSVYLTWTAPGDDGTSGAASSYHVRTSSYPILTEEDWDNAAGKYGEPVPSPFGTPEEMIMTGLNPGTHLYVAIRAQDDFFNWGPLGNCVYVLVRGADFEGYVMDACTGVPAAGIDVSAGILLDVTDANGYYSLENVPYFVTKLKVVDEHLPYPVLGDYYDCLVPLTISVTYNRLDFYIVPVLELVDIVTDIYDEGFLEFVKDVTMTDGHLGTPTILKSWNHYPLTVYNPPRMLEDLDLQVAAEGAMAEWESMTGLDLFTFTDDSLAADVCISYLDDPDNSVTRHHVETPELNPDGTPKKKLVVINLYNTAVPLSRYSHLVFAHEFGHVLCLYHSRDSGHLMLGLTLPNQKNVTTDEANLVKVIYHLPPVHDMANIPDYPYPD
jgi:hypothetical protein